MIALKRKDVETIGLGLGSILCQFGAARMVVISIHHATTWNVFWALYWLYGMLTTGIREALRKEDR